MGAWGTGAFENDTALDWIGCLRDAGSTAEVIAALQVVADSEPSEYIDSIQADEALAAAEIVAAAMEHVTPRLFPDLAAEWLAQYHPSFERETLVMAVRAVRRVLIDSETQQLWDETKYTAEWRWTMSNLISRLDSILIQQLGS